MSKIMIYAPLSAIGGTIENVWGTEMRVKSIDSNNKEVVDAAKYDGWSNHPRDVIEQVEVEKLQAENKVMKGQLGGDKRAKELEEQLSQALTEIAGLEETVAKNLEVFKDANSFIDEKNVRISELETELAGALIDSAKHESEFEHLKAKLAIYEEAKDANGNGKVDYKEMTNAELQKLLEQRKVDYNKRDGKDALIQKLKDSEVK